jgi:hypothetical protein
MTMSIRSRLWAHRHVLTTSRLICRERGNLAADLRDSRLKRQELETKIKELQSQVDQQQAWNFLYCYIL